MRKHRPRQWEHKSDRGGNQVVGHRRFGRPCSVKTGDLRGAGGEWDTTAQESQAS